MKKIAFETGNVVLNEDAEAIDVTDGSTITIPKGEEVTIVVHIKFEGRTIIVWRAYKFIIPDGTLVSTKK